MFHFRVFLNRWCRKKYTNQQIAFSLRYGLFTEKEGRASFISLSKEINLLTVHNNCSVSVLKLNFCLFAMGNSLELQPSPFNIFFQFGPSWIGGVACMQAFTYHSHNEKLVWCHHDLLTCDCFVQEEKKYPCQAQALPTPSLFSHLTKMHRQYYS